MFLPLSPDDWRFLLRSEVLPPVAPSIHPNTGLSVLCVSSRALASLPVDRNEEKMMINE